MKHAIRQTVSDLHVKVVAQHSAHAIIKVI